MVMDLCKGGELFDEVENLGCISELDVIDIIRQVLDLLSYLHSKNIMHRDIKMENILLKHGGNNYDQIILVDFGSALKF